MSVCSSKMETILFGGRDLLAQDHPTLGLLDHSPIRSRLWANASARTWLMGSCHRGACSSARVP